METVSNFCAQSLGVSAIGLGLAYFGIAMVITALLLMPIAKATYRVNEGEGYFRFRHARLKEFAESGVHRCKNDLGPAGGANVSRDMHLLGLSCMV